MMNKLISSVKPLLGAHSGMMALCMLLMAGAFWGLAGDRPEAQGLGSLAFFLPLIGCLVMCGGMAMLMGHGEKGKKGGCCKRQEDPVPQGDAKQLENTVQETPGQG